MWKYVTRGIRESIERRACRTNVYSQSSQDGNGNNTEQKKVVTSCDKRFITPSISIFYHGYCSGNTKHLGTKDKENQNRYDAKYTWTDAVGLSSILAVGCIVCQFLCIRRKIFEIDNTDLKKWRYKLLIHPQNQASKFINHFLLPQQKYILPVSKEPIVSVDTIDGKESIVSQDTSEILFDNASYIEQPHGPITAEEAFEQAVNEFSDTHNKIMGELEFDCGSIAIEEERYEDAVKHFTTGANLSSTGSMFNLALCYELGLGTSVDYAQAIKYYKQAANNGHADAMYNLGVFHAQGKGGLKTNLDVARQLFTEAAKKGQVQALEALELEKSVKKRRSQKNNTKYHLDAKLVNSNSENNVVTKLMNYGNILMTGLNSQTIDNDQYLDSYNKSIHSKSSTDTFLEILGIHERSAIPLISVGESGS